MMIMFCIVISMLYDIKYILTNKTIYNFFSWFWIVFMIIICAMDFLK